MLLIAFVLSESCLGFVSQSRVGRLSALKGATDDALVLYNEKFAKLKPGDLFYLEDDKLKKSFGVLASVYGDDVALEMTRRNPSCLAYNSDYFAPSFKAFANKFGDEEARAMVLRNPNLLAVAPTGYQGADSVQDDTMILSYVIDATRPFGKILLPTFFLLILTPAIEAVSGVPFRAIVLESLTGSN